MTAGLLDTSVVIDWHDPLVVAALPDEVAISAITAAELAAGPLLATTSAKRVRRQARLQEVEAKLEPIPFDTSAVRSCGLVVAAMVSEGHHPWGLSRYADRWGWSPRCRMASAAAIVASSTSRGTGPPR